MFEIKTHSRMSIFEQLKMQLLEYITAGILHENEQLPSVRMLASQLGINPSTVARAYKKLEDNELIYKIPGKGCYVSTRNIEHLIQEEKIGQFESCVRDLKRFNIPSHELTGRINRIYKEEEPYA